MRPLNRKRLWVPGNIAVLFAMVAGLAAAWPLGAARAAAIIGLGLFLIINAVTVLYFAPAVLRVERDGAMPDAPASHRWVRLSRWRAPLALGVVACLAFAILRLAAAMA